MLVEKPRIRLKHSFAPAYDMARNKEEASEISQLPAPQLPTESDALICARPTRFYTRFYFYFTHPL